MSITLEIYFCGLICHAGPSAEEGSDRTKLDVSYLLSDNFHTPQIRTSNNETERNLTNDVNFVNLGTGASAGNYFDAVPHLDDLTRVGRKFNKPNGIQVKLPKGSFSVVQWYTKGAIWTLDDDINVRPCVPRVTMLSATGDNVSVTYNGSTSESFRQNGWVLITNMENEELPHDGSDWKKQYAATNGSIDDIAAYRELDSGPPCKKSLSLGLFTAKVLSLITPFHLTDASECTNSHWP